MKHEAVRLDRVTYNQDGSTLMNNINLHIFRGEIFGLINLNSVGQDELVELLYKNIPLHFGNLYFGEKLVNSYRRGYRGSNRTAVIEKRSHLVNDLTVADNTFVLRPEFNRRIINRRELSARFESYTAMLGLDIDPGQYVSRLSNFQRSVVELLKAVITGCELVILRDLSNFIGQEDLRRLQKYIHTFAATGVSFLYICNHHEEAFQICDRIAMMEDGRIIKLLDRKHFRDETVMSYALDFSRLPSRKGGAAGINDTFRLEGIHTESIHGLDLSLAKGECVLLLDLDNTALDDLAGLAAGSKEYTGHIWLGGDKASPSELRKSQDIRLIRQNPTVAMLFRELSYMDNLCFTRAEKQRSLWRGKRMRRGIINEYKPIVGNDIHATSLDGLSKEALYDLVYYQTHLQNPRVVFLEQPFAGADMYLRHHLLYLINQLKERGIAIIILALSISDCLLVSDRMLTLKGGRVDMEYGVEDFYRLYARS